MRERRPLVGMDTFDTKYLGPELFRGGTIATIAGEDMDKETRSLAQVASETTSRTYLVGVQTSEGKAQDGQVVQEMQDGFLLPDRTMASGDSALCDLQSS